MSKVDLVCKHGANGDASWSLLGFEDEEHEILTKDIYCKKGKLTMQINLKNDLLS